MATLQWFSFDFNGGGFELHDTEELARDYASDCIKSAIGEVGIESFESGNETIFWGKLNIKQRASVVDGRVKLYDITE